MCWVMPPASLVDDVGVAQRVEQLGLAVVDVTHHGDDRRPRREVLLVALVGAELEVEGLEQLAVLVLGGDDLDDVVELLTEQLQRLVVDRLGGGDHLAEVEQHLHQRGRLDVDLVGEVGQRRASAPGARSRRCPCGRACHRSSAPPCCRTPDGAAACSCGHDATGPPGDRRRPGWSRDRRDARPDGHRRWDRSHPARHRAAGRRRHHRGSGHRPGPERHRDPGHRPGWEHHPGRRGRSRRLRATWASSRGWDAACRDRPRHRAPRAGAGCRCRDADPCPGRARTGCCRGAGCPDDPPVAGRGSRGAGRRVPPGLAPPRPAPPGSEARRRRRWRARPARPASRQARPPARRSRPPAPAPRRPAGGRAWRSASRRAWPGRPWRPLASRREPGRRP